MRGGHDYHRYTHANALLPARLDKPPPIEDWHHQIEQDRCRGRFTGTLECLSPVISRVYRVAFILEQLRDDAPYAGVIVDHQHAGHG